MIHEARAIAAEGEAIDLDPFAFWPDIASRLVGLGGAVRGDNPDYAFHTLYVACGTGPIVFTVRFAGLQAQRGTLIMRVHELPMVMGAHARQTAISQAQLADLIRGDGHVSLPAMARTGSSYALVGFIYGDTVASARKVMIEVARRAPEAHDPSRPTAFGAGRSRVAPARQIVREREGTLNTPVSQLCTQRQVEEPIFTAVMRQLGGGGDASTIGQWETVFIARVLDRYDVARSGARGLGIGAVSDPLGPWLVQHGCSLVVTTADAMAVDADPSDQITVRRAGDEQDGGFDFGWARRSSGVGGGDRQDVLHFIEEALRLLKPGGLFTAVVPIDVAPRAVGDDAGPWLRRPDIDRTVLLLLSRGHQVAQISPWGDAVAQADEHETAMISAFGLIVRKAA